MLLALLFAALAATAATAQDADSCDKLAFVNKKAIRFLNCSDGHVWSGYTAVGTGNIPVGPAVDWARRKYYILDANKGPEILELDLPFAEGFNASKPPRSVVKDSALRGRRNANCLVFDSVGGRLIYYRRAQTGKGAVFFSVNITAGTYHQIASHSQIDTDMIQISVHPSRGTIYFTDGRSLNMLLNEQVRELSGTSLPCVFNNDGTCYLSGLTVDTRRDRILFFQEDQESLVSTIKAKPLSGGSTKTIYKLILTDSQSAGSWSKRMAFGARSSLLFTETYRNSGGERALLQLPGAASNTVACIDRGLGGQSCSMTPETNTRFKKLGTVAMDTSSHMGNLEVLDGSTPGSSNPRPAGPQNDDDGADGAPRPGVSLLLAAAGVGTALALAL